MLWAVDAALVSLLVALVAYLYEGDPYGDRLHRDRDSRDPRPRQIPTALGELMNLFGSYTKVISSIVTAVIAWVTVVTQSAPAAISAAEWVAGAVLLAGALGVYGGSNASKS